MSTSDIRSLFDPKDAQIQQVIDTYEKIMEVYDALRPFIRGQDPKGSVEPRATDGTFKIEVSSSTLLHRIPRK